MILISVIICTYNRDNILRLCLDSLEKQESVDVNYEILIIDNNSADNTKNICKPFYKRNSNYKYIFEPRLGLSHARNRGYQEATGVYVAYIDDDAIACPDWLQQMIAFTERNTKAAAFGGPYEGYALVDIPNWLPPEYGSHSLSDDDKLVEIGKEWISGGNLVFKRSVLLERGGFNPDLGMKGCNTSYGEETRLLLDLKRDGYEIYYASKMKVKHLIADYKMSLLWLLKSRYEVGRVSALTFDSKGTLLRCLRSLVANLLRCIITLSRFEPMPFKRRLLYSLEGIFISFGMLVTYIVLSVEPITLFSRRKK